MRSLLLESGPAAEILSATTMSDTLGDQELVEKALNQILQKQNPSAATPGPDHETKGILR
jgi:hypothetical protein